jgi:hypothetical protein
MRVAAVASAYAALLQTAYIWFADERFGKWIGYAQKNGTPASRSAILKRSSSSAFIAKTRTVARPTGVLPLKRAPTN